MVFISFTNIFIFIYLCLCKLNLTKTKKKMLTFILDDGQVQFVLSRRGKPQLLYKGYLYNSDSTSNGRTYWRCSETRRGSCMARLVSTNDTVFEKQPIHDHPPKISRVEGKRVIEMVSYKEYMEYLNAAKPKLTQD